MSEVIYPDAEGGVRLLAQGFSSTDNSATAGGNVELVVGDIVVVASQTGSGINKRGGTGRITRSSAASQQRSDGTRTHREALAPMQVMQQLHAFVELAHGSACAHQRDGRHHTRRPPARACPLLDSLALLRGASLARGRGEAAGLRRRPAAVRGQRQGAARRWPSPAATAFRCIHWHRGSHRRQSRLWKDRTSQPSELASDRRSRRRHRLVDTQQRRLHSPLSGRSCRVAARQGSSCPC